MQQDENTVEPARSVSQPTRPGVVAESPAPAPSQVRTAPDGTRMGRVVSRLTGGSDSRGFRAALSIRRAGSRVSAQAVAYRGRLRRLPSHASPGHAAVRAFGFPVEARIVPTATPLAEQHRLVGVIGAALADQEVDYFVIPGPTNVFAIGVPGRNRSQLHAALAAVATAEDILVSPVRTREPMKFQPYPPKGLGAGTQQFAVWSPVVAAGGRSLLGADSHVIVQLWEPGRQGLLRAPSDNRYAPSLLKEAQAAKVHVTVGSSRQPAFPEMAETHIDDVTFPVDLVYTWVDGTDQAWRSRMLAARERHHLPVHPASMDESRFLSLDELRFSIRSAFTYTPWFRRIFLVTDHQVPPWLATSDPRVTVVSHEEIWGDPSQLPVFNSHAIESRLHHIPGLSEHYVYLNDDVFFGRMTPANTFFTPGGLFKFFASPTRIGLGGPVLGEPPGSTAAKNDREILRQAVGAIQTQRLKHTAHAQRRSVAHELEERFPAVYAATSGSTFRSPQDISPIALQTWYGYRTGKAVPGSVRYTYVGVSSRENLARLDELRDGQLTMFCLNQEEDKGTGTIVDRDELTREIQGFLDEYFPFQSQLER